MKRFCSLALLVVVLGWATGVRAESVIGKYSSNGVTIQSEIAVGYKDPVFGSSVAADFADDIDSDLASAINPLGMDDTNLQLEVLDNSVPFLTLTSGGPGAVVPLATAHNYDLVLDYKVTVPYGNDPPFAFGYTFTTSLIPEPSTFTLAALGLLGLAFVGWRRRKRE